MDTKIIQEIEVGGRSLTFETGHLAKQAGGSVLMRYGDTAALVTATGAKEVREGMNFFPLTVEFEEKMYAHGRIPGSFFRREGRASERGTLSARLIDRPIRPLFPDGYRKGVQVVVTVLSMDLDNPPDVLGMVGASAALELSSIPFQGPIAGVTVGLIDGEFIINPTEEERAASKLELTVAGTKEAIMMVEAGANEVSEEDVLQAILRGHDEIIRIVEAIEEFVSKAREAGIGREKEDFHPPQPDANLVNLVREAGEDRLKEVLINPDKQSRDLAIDEVKEDVMAKLLEDYPEEEGAIAEIFGQMVKDIVRHLISHDHIRPDGRKTTEIRPLTCEVDLLPRAHGSAVFTRGQTQVLTVTTLGSLRDNQLLDGLDGEETRRYLHHYNFPPFSVGEERPMRGPGRREVGHGALARKALEPVVPGEDVFPYTIRLVSEVLESNGSSSMASVCGSTLSLMAAGVPISKPVSGIAMGLIQDGDQYAILSDLQGMEDALGDMDFKVAGTKDGITAIQMDIKVDGLREEVLRDALAQAKEGRLFILEAMVATISEPREDLSPYAPRVETMKIDVDKIKDVIGSGGKTIRKIIEDTGVEIDVEDDGTINILSADAQACLAAMKMIEDIVKDPEVGEIYEGKVVKLMNFGAFVNILPGKDGLVHISELDKKRVAQVSDVLNVGDLVRVKVIEVDKQGRINLSRKALLD